jgi:Cd2+/Zn2+-exporting ATPase
MNGKSRRIAVNMTAAANESVETTSVRIDKMDCPTEEAVIRKRLAAEPGILDVRFDLLARVLTVKHAAGARAKLLGALADVDLPGEVLPSAGGPGVASAPGPARGWLADNARLLAGGAAAVGAELAALALGDTAWPVLLLALLAIALTGLVTYRKGWIAIRQRTLNINALMTIAVTGAVLIGQWPEAAMVMFLFAVAEAIEARSLARARRAIENLMAMAPDTATVQIAGRWTTLPAAAVPVGSLLRVRPGERLPLDGRVVSGSATVDQAPITGESMLVEKAAGDALFAGSINQDGEFEYQTTATADGSTLARIVRAVQEAQATQAPTQRVVDRFSAWYTPTVVVAALLLATVPPLLLGGGWLDWIYRALVMLVVACPCALVISTPVTVVSGLTAAARRGILVKGGLHLEGGHDLGAVALDKTGTLTLGKPSVTDVVVLQGSEPTQLRRAAALAARSDHPVSRAITLRWTSGDPLPEVDAFNALKGRGVTGRIEGVQYSLGNHRMVEEAGACTPALEAHLRAMEEQGRTAVVLVAEQQPLALFAVADTVRPESADAVRQLKALGVRPVMLTGDNRHTAAAIAAQVGIDDVRAELLPEDKLEIVARIQADGTRVGMVGDGINDAPALAKADIGFAMAAAGTDTAIETADVALMDDDPRKLAEFVRLSRAARAVLWQNIVLAIGIKGVFLILTMTGHATLWMAVFADMGTSLLVVLNGMHLLRSARTSDGAIQSNRLPK